jgi:hypothetical protein
MTKRRFSVVYSLCVTKAAKSGKEIGGQVSPLRMWDSLSSSRAGWVMVRLSDETLVGADMLFGCYDPEGDMD